MGVAGGVLRWRLLPIVAFVAIFIVGAQMCMSLSSTGGATVAEWMLAITFTVLGAVAAAWMVAMPFRTRR